MRQDIAQAPRADAPRAQVLVAVEPRPELGATVVEVHHHQPVEPDPAAECIEQRLDRGSRPQVVARAPEVRRVQAVTDPRRVHAVLDQRAVDRLQLVDRDAQAESAPRGILEDESGDARAGWHARQHGGDARRQRLHARFRAGPAMGPDVHVHERRTVRDAGPQVGGQDLDRLGVERRLVAREVDEIGGMDREGPDVELPEPLPEPRQLLGQRRPSTPRRRVVAEDLEGFGADLVRSLHRPDHPRAEWEMRTQPAPVGQHRPRA